jgi:integrase
MKKHLTDAAIQRYRPPKGGQTEIFDLGFPGLALRIGHGGAKSFVLFHRESGKLKRTTLGRWPRVSLADARNAWRRVAEGKAPTEKESKADLFSTVVEQWLRLDAAPRNKASSLRGLQHITDHDVLPVWRDKHIDEIGKSDVAALIDGIVERGAPVKARRVHAHLHRMFKWCVGRGIIPVSPMEGMERPGKEVSRERVLTDSELAAIWHASERQGAPGAVVRMLMLTGARLNEIGQLKWSEVEGNAIHLANGRTKNGTQHIIPLSAPARKLLDAMPRIGEYVFTYDGAKAVSGWSRNKRNLDAACGVEGWVYHDLRRTTATGMQKLGVTLQVVEAVLGHTSGSRAGIVGVYQRHDFANEKRAALEAWGEHVMALQK